MSYAKPNYKTLNQFSCKRKKQHYTEICENNFFSKISQLYTVKIR